MNCFYFYFRFAVLFSIFWPASTSDSYESVEIENQGGVPLMSKLEYSVSLRFYDESITHEQKAAVSEYFRAHGPRMVEDLIENNFTSAKQFCSALIGFRLAFGIHGRKFNGATRITISIFQSKNPPSATSPLKYCADPDPLLFEKVSHIETRSNERRLDISIDPVGFQFTPEERAQYKNLSKNLSTHYGSNNRFELQRCFMEIYGAGYSIIKIVNNSPEYDEFKFLLIRRPSNNGVDDLKNGGVLKVRKHYFYPANKIGIYFDCNDLVCNEAIVNYLRNDAYRLEAMITKNDIDAVESFYADLNTRGFVYAVVIEKVDDDTNVFTYISKPDSQFTASDTVFYLFTDSY